MTIIKINTNFNIIHTINIINIIIIFRVVIDFRRRYQGTQVTSAHMQQHMFAKEGGREKDLLEVLEE